MNSYLSVKNESSIPIISVYSDDELLFSDITKGNQTIYKACPCGSRAVKITDGRCKTVFDLWLSIAPHCRHRLLISDTGCKIFTTSSLV